jgi:hypothetical protein
MQGTDGRQKRCSPAALHWELVLPHQLDRLQERLAATATQCSDQGDVPKRAHVARPGKRAKDAQNQSERRQLLLTLPPDLLPFAKGPPSDQPDKKRRKPFLEADSSPFWHAKLTKGAKQKGRQEQWLAAGYSQKDFELMHPAGRGLEVKMCGSTIVTDCRFDCVNSPLQLARKLIVFPCRT